MCPIKDGSMVNLSLFVHRSVSWQTLEHCGLFGCHTTYTCGHTHLIYNCSNLGDAVVVPTIVCYVIDK